MLPRAETVGSRKMKRCVSAFLLAAVVAFVAVFNSGCKTGIPAQDLMPEVSESPKKRPQTVVVRVVTGTVGFENHQNFTGEAFAEALAESIRKSGVFADAKTSGSGQYRLDGIVTTLHVATTHVEYQELLLKESHRIRSNWRLVRQSDSHEVWNELISTSDSATVPYGVLTDMINKIVTEGAAKKCIEEVIKGLIAADF